MGALERDAVKLVRELADSNRQGTAWFYGFFIILVIFAGIITGIGAIIRDVTPQEWAVTGGALGFLALVILLVVIANRREWRSPRRSRGCQCFQCTRRHQYETAARPSRLR